MQVLKPAIGMGATMVVSLIKIPVTIIDIKKSRVYVQEDRVIYPNMFDREEETTYAPNPKSGIIRFVKTKIGYISKCGFFLNIGKRMCNMPVTRIDRKWIQFITCHTNRNNEIFPKRKKKNN